ncbi:hypothetical protein F971_00398 [Acinetobacter vivianii]|uniref:Uncharacterized protein n=1 Tax=Acinetobacter vivianii TaxID=1776742 RepID=N8V2X0_9GAMM|nr:hypothetical protein [Acinetobacter vivianii]ENU93960.1 hypothetical protein F971_00398 [Acinetobacter vivianii]
MKNVFLKSNYRSNYRGKVSVEDALKHQAFIDDMKKDAVFYHLDDLDGATVPYSMLHRIIQKLKTLNGDFTLPEKSYLNRQGLLALKRFTETEISFNQYRKDAALEKIKRIEVGQEEKLRLDHLKELELIEEKKKQEKLSRERKLKDQVEREKQRIRESDPKFIARQKEKALFKKYELEPFHIPNELRSRLLRILSLLEREQRLSDNDRIWLTSEGYEFFTGKLKNKFHRIEAEFYLQEYKVKKSNWSAINATSHLRKCQASKEAETFLENTKISVSGEKKVLSAYFTTLGGVKRDLKKTDLAIEHGIRAHEIKPKDYRPCTLLGAIYMETHNYTLGHEWYEKARERGAPENSINSELKSILFKLDQRKRSEMIENLLKKDRVVYGWLRALK